MLKRTRRRPVITICLVTTMIMSTALGVGYAGWNDTLRVDAKISTGEIDVTPQLEPVSNGLWANTKVSGQTLQVGPWVYDYTIENQEKATNQTNTMAIYRIDDHIFKIAFIIKNTGTVDISVKNSRIDVEQTRAGQNIWYHTKYGYLSPSGEALHMIVGSEKKDESTVIAAGESVLFYYETALEENTRVQCYEDEATVGLDYIQPGDYIEVEIELDYQHGEDSWSDTESFVFGREVNHQEYQY